MIFMPKKEVNFFEYCRKCKHYKNLPWEDPCDECLENPCNEDSHKPINFEEEKHESESIQRYF